MTFPQNKQLLHFILSFCDKETQTSLANTCSAMNTLVNELPHRRQTIDSKREAEVEYKGMYMRIRMCAWINYALLLAFPIILVFTNDLAVYWMRIAFGCWRAIHMMYAITFMPGRFSYNYLVDRIQARQQLMDQFDERTANIMFCCFVVCFSFFIPLSSTWVYVIGAMLQDDPIMRLAYMRRSLLFVQGVLWVVLDSLCIAAACVATTGPTALFCAYTFLVTFVLACLVSCWIVVYHKWVCENEYLSMNEVCLHFSVFVLVGSLAIPFGPATPLIEWNQTTTDVAAISTHCRISLNGYDIPAVNCAAFGAEDQLNMMTPIYLSQQPYANARAPSLERISSNNSIGFLDVDSQKLCLYFDDASPTQIDLAELQFHALECVATMFLTNVSGIRAIDLATFISNQTFLSAEAYTLYVSSCSPSPVQALAIKHTWVSAYKTVHPFATIIAFVPAFMPFIFLLILNLVHFRTATSHSFHIISGRSRSSNNYINDIPGIFSPCLLYSKILQKEEEIIYHRYGSIL